MSNKKDRIQQLIKSGKRDKAVILLEKSCKKKPKDKESWETLGFLYGEMGVFEKAKECLIKAVNLESNFSGSIRANNGLASLFIKSKDYTSAIPFYQKSLLLNNDQANTWFDLAGCFKEENHINNAVEAYLESLKIKPQQNVACRILAQLYEQTHDLINSRIYAELAIQYSKNDIESHFILAKLDSREKKLDSAITRLEILLNGELPLRHRAIILLELGMVQDKLCKYNDSFKSISEGNQLLEKLYTPHRLESNVKEYRLEVERYRNALSVDKTIKWRDESLVNKKLNMIFLVGFPRSGTTLTEQILESHPDIVATHEIPAIPRLSRKIEEYIGRSFDYPADVSSLNSKDINILRDKYMQIMSDNLLDDIDESKYLLDKLPLNIIHIPLISRVFPEAKILLALRDPRDVCLSCFMQNFKVNQAMRQFLTINDTVNFYHAVMNYFLYCKDELEIDVLETRYESIVEDLEGSARKLLAFVGVDWDESVLMFYKSAKTRQVHTPSYQAVTQPIYKGSIGKWKNYGENFKPHLPVLNSLLEEFSYK